MVEIPEALVNLSQIVANIVALVAIVGLFVQLKELRKQVQASAIASSVEHLVPLSMHLLNNPQMYKYFYEEAEPPGEGEEALQVRILSAMILDYFGHLIEASKHYPKEMGCDRQLRWMQYVFDNSPAVRELYSNNPGWYHTELAKLRTLPIRSKPTPPVKARLVRRRHVKILSEEASKSFGDAQAGEKVKASLNMHMRAGLYLPLFMQPVGFIRTEYYVMLDAEKKVIGMSGLYHPSWIGKDVLYIGWFFVYESAKGGGYGHAILDRTIAIARKHGCTRLMVETSPDLKAARKLYESHGFATVAIVPDYWARGSDLVLMTRVI
jgi:GNAT superfamily N-acetyltransferase